MLKPEEQGAMNDHIEWIEGQVCMVGDLVGSSNRY